jgi:hypothetical protein
LPRSGGSRRGDTLANSPDEAHQLARDGGDHHVLRLARRRQPVIAIVQPQLRFQAILTISSSTPSCRRWISWPMRGALA